MEGVNKIKDKIRNDAEEQVKEIMAESDKEVAKVKSMSKKEMDDYQKSFEERTKAMVLLYEQKTLAQARLKVKKNTLQKREEIINNSLEKSKKLLKGTKYKQLIETLIKNAVKDLSKELMVSCSKSDSKTVKDICESEGLNAEVKEVEISGGVILEDSEGKRIDESLSLIIDRKKDTIRQKVVKALG